MATAQQKKRKYSTQATMAAACDVPYGMNADSSARVCSTGQPSAVAVIIVDRFQHCACNCKFEFATPHLVFRAMNVLRNNLGKVTH